MQYKTGAKYTIDHSSPIYNFISQELEIYNGGPLEYVGPIKVGNAEIFPLFKLAAKYIMPVNPSVKELGAVNF